MSTVTLLLISCMSRGGHCQRVRSRIGPYGSASLTFWPLNKIVLGHVAVLTFTKKTENDRKRPAMTSHQRYHYIVVFPTSRRTARWLLRHAALRDNYRQYHVNKSFLLVECIRHMLVIGRWPFWSWLGINRSFIYKDTHGKKRFSRFRSQWPWSLTFDSIFVPLVTLVQRYVFTKLENGFAVSRKSEARDVRTDGRNTTLNVAQLLGRATCCLVCCWWSMVMYGGWTRALTVAVMTASHTVTSSNVTSPTHRVLKSAALYSLSTDIT